MHGSPRAEEAARGRGGRGRGGVDDRLEREHEELFHELRAVIPGAEVLFAFLLSVAFTERFERLSGAQRSVHLAVFLSVALALVLLLAPAAFHRIQFRQRDKEAMLRLANREAIVAMSLLSIAIAGTVHLIVDFALGPSAAALAAGSLLLATCWVWWIVPLQRRVRRDASRPADGRSDVGRPDDGPSDGDRRVSPG